MLSMLGKTFCRQQLKYCPLSDREKGDKTIITEQSVFKALKDI